MRKIFISYRRAEAEYAAGALGRELRRHFGDDQIFRDKEDIAGGVAWKQHVLHAIDRDAALLILISRDWADMKDEEGRRRLDNADDPLRLEIGDGIRDGAAIIPVLLENAQMPDADELPLDIRPLADYNALRLRDSDWQYDLDNICRTLERAGFRRAAVTPPTPPPAAERKPESGMKALGAKGVVGIVLMLISVIALASDDLDRDGHLGVLMFAVVGLVLGILTWRENRTWSRVVGIVVSVVSVVAFFAAIGGMEPESVTTGGKLPDRAPNSNRLVSSPPADAPASRPGEGTVVPLLRGRVSIQYDPGLWRVDPDTRTEPGSYQYVHSSGEVYFKIITERLQIGREQLAESGVLNVKKVDPAAVVTRQGSRRVNGLEMSIREIDATINEMPLTFYVHYYSDANGSIQLVGWTGRALLDEHRPAIEQFVNGFQVDRR